MIFNLFKSIFKLSMLCSNCDKFMSKTNLLLLNSWHSSFECFTHGEKSSKYHESLKEMQVWLFIKIQVQISVVGGHVAGQGFYSSNGNLSKVITLNPQCIMKTKELKPPPPESGLLLIPPHTGPYSGSL